MDIVKAIESLKLKFTSGNEIPVDRATITKDEWETIKNFCEKHRYRMHFDLKNRKYS